jgi:hypothetical protein
MLEGIIQHHGIRLKLPHRPLPGHRSPSADQYWHAPQMLGE